MNTLERIHRARTVLELPEHATLREIKNSHKRLLKKWHPDRCRKSLEECHEKTAEINESYEVILSFIEQYKFSFSEEEVRKYLTDDEWWLDRFGKDPLWGPG